MKKPAMWRPEFLIYKLFTLTYQLTLVFYFLIQALLLHVLNSFYSEIFIYFYQIKQK